jgi:hypothetical protein
MGVWNLIKSTFLLPLNSSKELPIPFPTKKITRGQRQEHFFDSIPQNHGAIFALEHIHQSEPKFHQNLINIATFHNMGYLALEFPIEAIHNLNLLPLFTNKNDIADTEP